MILPVKDTEGLRVAPGTGAIRFWFKPEGLDVVRGPGIYPRLLEMVEVQNLTVRVRWSLYYSPAEQAIYLTGPGNSGMADLLKAPADLVPEQWRLVTLYYSDTATALYLDGLLAAQGPGLLPIRAADQDWCGLIVGTDHQAANSANGEFEELTTFDYWPEASWQKAYYKACRKRAAMGPQESPEAETLKALIIETEAMAMTSSTGLEPPDMGDPVPFPPDPPSSPSVYPTNSLWLEMVSATGGVATVVLHGTEYPNVYELLSKEHLTNTQWEAETPLVLAAEGQDWTLASFTLGGRTNALFLTARSYIDADDDGLPDWWEMENASGVDGDPYADSDGDGWNNLAEYRNGTRPTLFDKPPAPQCPTASYYPQSNAVLMTWFPAPGPVTNYVLELFSYPDGLHTVNVNPPATSCLLYVTAIDPGFDAWCRLRAQYAGGDSGWSMESQPYTPSTNAALVSLTSSNTWLLLVRTPTVASQVWLTQPAPDGFIQAKIPVNAASAYEIPTWFLAESAEQFGCYAQFLYADGSLSQPITLGTINNRGVVNQLLAQQNLEFVLRGATRDLSFSFEKKHFSSHRFEQPQTYAFSKIYDDPPATHQNVASSMMNHLYRNFLFAEEDLTSVGELRTGASVDPVQLTLNVNEWSYLYSDVWGAPSAPLLSSLSASWILNAPVYLAESNDISSRGITRNSQGVTLEATATNLYGLRFESALIVFGDKPTNRVRIEAGVTVPFRKGTVFHQTVTPLLETEDYFFSLASSDAGSWPAPGDPDFDPSAPSPLLIVGGDVEQRFAAYARQRLINGNPEVRAFRGEYFDVAYTLDPATGVPVKSTGMLTPSGSFLAGEPGPVALVTMPDLATGQRGTGIVHVLKLQLDVDHNGKMDLSFGGPDNTSQARPMLWWVNSDWDEPASGSQPDRDLQVATNMFDYNIGHMRCQRNLEDFARLWVVGLPKLPETNGYTVTLSMSALSGNPAINLYAQYDTNGSPAYLSDTSVAAAQFTKFYLNDQLVLDYGQKLKTINASQSYTLPVYSDGTPQYTKFLYEGAGIGLCQLTLTISQITGQGSNVLAQTSTWIDLHDVKDFYERVVITNSFNGAISNWSSGVQTIEYPRATMDDDTNIIVFVHGINNTVPDWLTSSDTILKRLYWSGYRGRFATVKWPCKYLPPRTHPFDFNLSEFYGYKSAAALKDYLNQLRQERFPNYKLHVFAHSQGNAVASEALGQGAPFDTYILTQAAMPASSYDTQAPTLQKLLDSEAIEPTPDWKVMGYRGAYTNITGRCVNLFNPQDYALATGTFALLQSNWEQNQKVAKPDGISGARNYASDGTNGYAVIDVDLYRLVTDSQECRGMVARSRTKAVGALGPATGQTTQGIISSALDLNATFGFFDTRDEHSAEFTRRIQNCWRYYDQLLEECLIPQIQRQ